MSGEFDKMTTAHFGLLFFFFPKPCTETRAIFYNKRQGNPNFFFLTDLIGKCGRFARKAACRGCAFTTNASSPCITPPPATEPTIPTPVELPRRLPMVLPRAPMRPMPITEPRVLLLPPPLLPLLVATLKVLTLLVKVLKYPPSFLPLALPPGLALPVRLPLRMLPLPSPLEPPPPAAASTPCCSPTPEGAKR